MTRSQYGYDEPPRHRGMIRPDDDRAARVSVHTLLFLDALCRLLTDALDPSVVRSTELRGLLGGLASEHARWRALTGHQADLEQRYGWHGGRDDD